MELPMPTAEAMRSWGRRLAELLRPGDVVVVSGDLGAGKTTLAQGVGDGLGVRGPVTSPTFVIARVHPSLVAGPPLVHVDAYRLESIVEVDDLDLDTSLDGAVMVVEWGEGLVEGLAPDRLEVTIVRHRGGSPGPDGDVDDIGPDEQDEPRLVRVRAVGDRWAGVQLPDEPTSPPADHTSLPGGRLSQPVALPDPPTDVIVAPSAEPAGG
ncbi:MAG: tRNA (adenosine(37)-N6)-threonylcarbamoyltransferase complex ATPase subunit type 1 TsaE [Angustibacter sp.]